MTTPEPESDDSYPSSWKPRERVERDEAAGIELLAAETWLASLPPRELTLMLQRIEAMR